MLRMIAATLFCFFCMGAPVWAGEADSFDPDQPFQQALTNKLLRSLLNQALDRLEDHVEIVGKIDPEKVKGDRRGQLELRFYPEGKSKSGQHLTAKGWFQFSPETGEHDWHLKFKLPEERSKKTPQPPESPL